MIGVLGVRYWHWLDSVLALVTRTSACAQIRRPNHRQADKIGHQGTLNLVDRALGTHCETWQRHEAFWQGVVVG